MIKLIDKPFVQACENNRAAIAEVIAPYLRGVNTVLEIGSGTAQHAVHFGERFPETQWQTSDLLAQHHGINAWLAEARLTNVLAPLELDMAAPVWPVRQVEAVYLANVVHIVPWSHVQALFRNLALVLQHGGLLFFYGPFNYGGCFTSEGNRRLNDWLTAQNSAFGIRDFEAVDLLARDIGLSLVDDCTMPANNRTLIWRNFADPEVGP